MGSAVNSSWAKGVDQTLDRFLDIARELWTECASWDALEADIKRNQTTRIPEAFRGPDAVTFTRMLDSHRRIIRDHRHRTSALSRFVCELYCDYAFEKMSESRKLRLRELGNESWMGKGYRAEVWLMERIPGVDIPTFEENLPRPKRPSVPTAPNFNRTFFATYWVGDMMGDL